MQVAFYAPLKPVDHPVPSGDRLIAQLLCDALRLADMNVDIASRFRSRVADGNGMRQARLAELGTKLAGRLIRQYQNGTRPRPDIWFTYHLYYKAPDWIGPIVAHTLDIPYVVAEASFAPKRAGGPWHQSHMAVETALRHCDGVFSLNRSDMECLRDICPDEVLHFIPPFTRIDQWTAPARPQPDANAIKLVTTAMMRDGDKFASFKALADALGQLINRGISNWHLTIVGDGPARNRVETLFDDQGIAANQVSFAGLCVPTETRDILAKSDLFVWPAINEAFGMAMLEAQASGLPVLAGDAGGVSGIVSNGLTGWLVPEGNAVVFADRLESCLTKDVLALRSFGQAGASKASQHHTLSAAANILGASLRKIAANHRKDGE